MSADNESRTTKVAALAAAAAIAVGGVAAMAGVAQTQGSRPAAATHTVGAGVSPMGQVKFSF